MPFVVIERDQPDQPGDFLTYGGFPVVGVYASRADARAATEEAPAERTSLRVSTAIATDVRETMKSAEELPSGRYRWPVPEAERER
jgi:hypothetical protein